MDPSDLPSLPEIPPEQLFSTNAHPESPKPPNPTWTGILVVAPAEMVVSAKTIPILTVRGTFRLPAPQYPAGARWKLVLTDRASPAKPSSAFMGQRDPSPSEPDQERKLDPAKLAKLTYVGHLNADLCGTLQFIPQAGQYVLRVELGPLKSNEVALKVISR